MSEPLTAPLPWRSFNILVVSPTPTHPQDHGNRKRIFEVCAALKRRGAAVHFVHYPSEHDWRHDWPKRYDDQMRAAWDSYQLVAPSRELHPDAIGWNHDIDEWADPDLSHFIAWACRVRTYDMVLVNYTWMSFCFNAVPDKVFKLCDTHDVFGGRREMLEANNIAPEFFHTTKDGEARGLSRADLVWAIKDSEKDYFEQELKLPNCLTMLHAEPERSWWTAPPSTDGWLRAGVIGARNNVNRRNLEKFLDTALPLLRDYMAPVKIVIAGGCSDDFAGRVHPNLEILGRLPDVEDFYRGVDVVIAPMQFSTGLKIKVSEALASGAPLIAHAHAMEGYPTSEPLHQLTSFKDMAVELVKLSFDRAPLAQLAQRSHIVCAAVQASADNALEATRRRLVAKFASMICVIAPMEALDPASLLHDHLIAALDCLRFTASLTVYVTGAPAKPAKGIMERFDLSNQMFVDPALAALLGDETPETWVAADLADFLDVRGYERAYVMADCRDVLRFGLGNLRKVFVRHDAVELAGGDADAVVDYFRAGAEVCVIGATPSPLFPWQGQAGVTELVHAPFRRTGGFESLPRRAGPANYARTLLILARDGDPIAEGLVDLADRLGVGATIVDPSDPAVRRALLGCAGVKPPQDPLSAFAQLFLVVDMTSRNSLATVIGEAALRLGIPRLAFQRGAVAMALHAFPRSLYPTSIARLFTTVADAAASRTALDALRVEATREASTRFSADAGWTILWRLLTKAADSANGAEKNDAAKTLWGSVAG